MPGVRVVYPLHCNPAVREIAEAELRGCCRVQVVEPLGVVDFHNLLARCALVLTDSGGIQKEATALSKPVLVLREETERPEGIRAGTLRLVGTRESEVEKWFRGLLLDERAYGEMAKVGCPFGDGRASERIADILQRELGMDAGA
jgi:UDP-N-acetylglucosamine 2-epimerase (non-hydrolysing)